MVDRNLPATTRFENGHTRRGRPPGSMNKNTRALKDAIILAAERFGRDGQGKDGLEGYLLRLATYEPVAYAGLLKAVLPIQVKDISERPPPTFTVIERVIIDGATGEVIPPPSKPPRRPMRIVNPQSDDDEC